MGCAEEGAFLTFAWVVVLGSTVPLECRSRPLSTALATGAFFERPAPH
jgi:hypothetical protein